MTMKFSGDAFTAVRESRGMTIYRVAEDTGLSYPTVRAYEKKGSCPSLDAAVRLAEILECSVYDFLDGATEPARATVDPKPAYDEPKPIDEYQALIQKKADQKGELSPADMDRLLALEKENMAFAPPLESESDRYEWAYNPMVSVLEAGKRMALESQDAPAEVTDAERIVRQQYIEEVSVETDDEFEKIRKEQDLEKAAKAEQDEAL